MEDEKILEQIKKIKAQIDDLKNQIIDFELPKNYDKMSEEEKKAYHKKQEQLKKEALGNMNNYSVITNDYTVVKYPQKRAMVLAFSRDIGSLSSIPIERNSFQKFVPAKYKELHKQNLEEIEKLIERYNSTKAIRNDRIEFGVNFNNFCENYLSKLACKNLDNQANKVFLSKYLKMPDKNGDAIASGFRFQNLTDDQRKDLIKIRIKVFGEKLNRLQNIAEIKIKNDSSSKVTSFLEKHGIMNNDYAFRDGSKRFTTTKSVVSRSGIDMSSKNVKSKRKKSELVSDAITESDRYSNSANRLIELNILHGKFIDYIKNYKGNGRQFSIEFSQNFPTIADRLYKQTKKPGTLSFNGENLASSPISVQEHEIEKEFQSEFKKIDFRMKYKAFYIPAAEEFSVGFLGKFLTNSKTETEKNLDKLKVKEYERELNNIAMKEDLVGYENIINTVNSSIKKEFNNHIEKGKTNFSGLNEFSKKIELKKFISNRIDQLKQKVHKNKFFSLGSDVLEKMNGILIDRSEKMTTKEMKNIFAALGQEKSEVYKHILQSVKEFSSKYDVEKSEIEKLSLTLDKLSKNPYSYENNKQIQNTIKEIDSHNKKMSLIKSSLENAQVKKLNFEKNFADSQINQAITSNLGKNISYNMSKSVFDRYDFPAVDAFGETYLIEKNSLEGKQVEKIISSFIMNFKNQVQNMKLSFDNVENVEMQDYISRLENRIDDDFGSNIRDLKKTEKFLSLQLENKENDKIEGYVDALDKYLHRLNKIESDLIKKLKSMNIEIGNVTLSKKQK